MKRFTGSRVLVTGAADGIGAASVTAFLGEGARVLAVDINPPRGDVPACHYEILDVTEANAPERLVASAGRELGGLDVLVNNAGICEVSPLASTDDDTWDRVMDVNLRAMFRLSRSALPLLRESGAGRVINIASISARFANDGMGAYSASKHAVAGLSKSLAAEWGEDGITCNYILPGAMIVS
jgi:NAD(P)-dependent dehydrogenase (short-subunit alcohol dehydrogenase family)